MQNHNHYCAKHTGTIWSYEIMSLTLLQKSNGSTETTSTEINLRKQKWKKWLWYFFAVKSDLITFEETFFWHCYTVFDIHVDILVASWTKVTHGPTVEKPRHTEQDTPSLRWWLWFSEWRWSRFVHSTLEQWGSYRKSHFFVIVGFHFITSLMIF